MKIYTLYRITSPSSKVYYGITTDIEQRRKTYSWKACKSQKILYSSIIKYGWKNHSLEIIEENLSKEEAFSKEKEYIQTQKSIGNCLNITDGGESSPDVLNVITYQYDLQGDMIRTYKSIREASNENNIPEKQIAVAMWKGTHYCKGYLWFKNNTDILSFKRKKKGPKYKPVNQYSLDGKLLNSFESLQEASLATGTINTGISNCIKGKSKTANKFIWKQK